MVRPKILLMGPMPYIRQQFHARISPLADIVELSSRTMDELEADMKSKYQGLVAVYHFRDPGSYFGFLGEPFFSKLPKSCRTLCHLGAGYDDIDVHAAKRFGVTVTNTPGAVDDATATTAVYLIISAMRQFARAEIACRNNQWKKQLPLARDPEHKTLGIIGLGGIGQVVARRMALGWNTKVIYHNRRPLASLPDGYHAEYKATVEELLAEADIVSIHLPLVAETKNYFGKKHFDAMKPGSIFVNTASYVLPPYPDLSLAQPHMTHVGRGGLVDEAALLGALDSGKLHGVGLDVYADEPRINSELFKHPNVTLLPHMGTETWDSRNKMASIVLDNILAALEGRALPNIVPEHL